MADSGAVGGWGGVWTLLLALPLAGAAVAQGPAPDRAADGDDVPTIVVTPDDPLIESDRKLSKLIKGLPGADDPVAVKRSVGEKIGDFYRSRRDPNMLSPDAQQSVKRAIEGDPAHPNLQ